MISRRAYVIVDRIAAETHRLSFHERGVLFKFEANTRATRCEKNSHRLVDGTTAVTVSCREYIERVSRGVRKEGMEGGKERGREEGRDEPTCAARSFMHLCHAGQKPRFLGRIDGSAAPRRYDIRIVLLFFSASLSGKAVFTRCALARLHRRWRFSVGSIALGGEGAKPNFIRLPLFFRHGGRAIPGLRRAVFHTAAFAALLRKNARLASSLTPSAVSSSRRARRPPRDKDRHRDEDE